MAGIKSAFRSIDTRMIVIGIVSGIAWTIGSKLAERAEKKVAEAAHAIANPAEDDE